MEKLPHERLREAEGFGDICYYFDYDGDEEYEAYSKIADEIERYYLPRPRFEDGEPVQFGDEVEGCDGFLEAFLLFNDGSGNAYGENDDLWKNVNAGKELYPCELLKRPAKVLDADGIELKPGEKPYHIYKGKQMPPIESVHKAGERNKQGHIVDEDFVCFVGDDKEWDYAKHFIHREPDSYDKVVRYLEDYADAADSMPSQIVREIANRMIAIMERDAQ